MIQHAYVGLGSNLGDRAGYLLLAVRGMLDAGLDVIRLSSIYETEAVDHEDQPPFLNMVAELRGSTLPAPDQVMARLRRTEGHARRRGDWAAARARTRASERGDVSEQGARAG